jgi:sugar phosphate permease
MGDIDEDWVEFDATFLGVLDSVFLCFYAIGLYAGGNLEDRLSVRAVMPIGMLGSALATGIIAMLGWSDEPNKLAFICLWAANGLRQAVVWPGTVAIIGNWFSEGKRGVAMGAFSPSSNCGNMMGSFIAWLVLNPLGQHWPLVTFTSA